MVLVKVIFGYKSVKCDANFIILFLLLSKMIYAFNILKHVYFLPHLNSINILPC